MSWETHQISPDVATLVADRNARTGRSILHELDDAELTDLMPASPGRCPRMKPL